MDKTLQALTLLTQSMAQANIAVPLIFAAISGIAAIVKGITGSGPTVVELADLIDQQIAANDTFGKAEIARLKALISRPPDP